MTKNSIFYFLFSKFRLIFLFSIFYFLFSKFRLIFLFSIFYFLFSFFTGEAGAEGASLYLSPASGTFFAGSTFDVSIFVNTGGNNVNSVKVDLKFDPRKIQIASPTAGKSFISVWVAHPAYSNTQGTASFQGGMPSPGINTSSGLISTITLRVVAPGETAISFLDSSKVLLDDGKGTNILSSLGRGNYLLTLPPPEGPKIASPTHADQNKWYNNNSPTLSWEKEDFVTDFSYGLDKSFFGDVDNVSEGGHTSVSFADLEDGIWYFHIKARKGNIWGGASRYILQVDKTPPASFQLNFSPTLRSSYIVPQEPILTFITTDNLSGISYYSLKLIDLNRGIADGGFFIEIDSPYKMPRLGPGEYEVVVRVFDDAMNFADSAKKIEVVQTDKLFYVSKRGVGSFTLFFELWKAVLAMIILIIISIGIIGWGINRQKRLRRAEKSLREAEEKLRKNKEDFSRKIYGQ